MESADLELDSVQNATFGAPFVESNPTQAAIEAISGDAEQEASLDDPLNDDEVGGLSKQSENVQHDTMPWDTVFDSEKSLPDEEVLEQEPNDSGGEDTLNSVVDGEDGGKELDLTFEGLFGEADVDEMGEDHFTNAPHKETTDGVDKGEVEDDAIPFTLEDIFGGDMETEIGDSSSLRKDEQATRPAHIAEIQLPFLQSMTEEQKEKLYSAHIPHSLHFEERMYDPALLPKELARRKGSVITADNVVRWRRLEDASMQSNARVVEWDNGDVHLFVGREVYDISKHFVTFDNTYMFEKTPAGVYACQHRFSTAMRIRTCLQRKSRAAELMSKRIQNEFQRKYYGRELKMTLTDKAARPPPEARKEIGSMDRRRQSIMKRASASETGMPSRNDTTALDETDDFEAANRLSQIKRSGGATGTKRKRTNADDADEPVEKGVQHF